MNKLEAKEAMRQGRKVTHECFTSEEWATIKNGKVLTEDGCRSDPKEWWLYRDAPGFDINWSIFKDNTVSPIDTQEITDNNKLIAKFMGEVINDSSGWRVYLPTLRNISVGYGSDELQYNSSWDWLMPVVDKIFKSQYLDLGYDSYQTEEALSIADCLAWNKGIETTYKAVVEFIKWYTKQPPPDLKALGFNDLDSLEGYISQNKDILPPKKVTELKALAARHKNHTDEA